MATSIGQYAPVFLPGDPPWQRRIRHNWSNPECIDARFFFFFFAYGSSAPVRVECEGGAAAWLVGTLVAHLVWTSPGHGLPPQEAHNHRSYGPIRVFLQASCSWQLHGLFGQTFSVVLPIQALRGLPCLGSFSVVQHVRHIKEHSGWGPTL